MNTVRNTTLNLISILAYIAAIAVIVVAYNTVGAVLAAVSITGIVAWMLQVFAAYVTVVLGVSAAAYNATSWFLCGIHKVLYNDTAEE
jgi:hypothetical protein